MNVCSPRKSRFFAGLALLAAFALASFAVAQDKREAPGGKEADWLLLFTSAGTARAGALPAAPQASRFRAVTINSALIEPGGVAVGDRIYMSPFDDVAALGTVDRVDTDVNGVVAVRARIAGSDGYLIMSSDGGGRSASSRCPAAASSSSPVRRPRRSIPSGNSLRAPGSRSTTVLLSFPRPRPRPGLLCRRWRRLIPRPSSTGSIA